jgi:hypothetical protein
MPNGVICGGAVDGSNQLGAMVTCHAMTASPVGVVWPAARATVTSVRERAASSERSRRRGAMFVPRGGPDAAEAVGVPLGAPSLDPNPVQAKRAGA